MLPALALVVTAGVASSLAGCMPRYSILAQTVPDPLYGASTFYVEPIHFDPPVVGGGSEADFLADKSPDQRDSWLVDKQETSSRYLAALVEALPAVRFVAQPQPGVFIVRPIVPFIEPGFYAGIVARPTEMQMRVQILASDGRLLDDIMAPSVIGASMVTAASGTRMRLAGEDLGRVTASYLQKRIAPGS